MKNRVKGRGNFIFSNTRIAVFFPFSTNGRKWKTGEWRRETKEKGGMEEGGKAEWKMVESWQGEN